MIRFDNFRRAIFGIVTGSALMLGGCASLPSSGPTAHDVVRGTEPGANKGPNTVDMRLVDIDRTVVGEVAAANAQADARLPTLASLTRPGRNDVVGTGDELDISVFEIGASLFGAARTTPEGYDPSAQNQRFAALPVDRTGSIRLPYAGVLHVAGKTPTEIATIIERAYRGKSQNPQVMVAIHSNLSETVYFTGDVRRPGRVALTLRDERLLDGIANAGGAVALSPDMVVRVTRDGQQIAVRLDRIRAGSADDLPLVAGDRVELIRKPQSFVVLGASNRVAQITFDQTDLTLAEALARAAGLNDNAANPRAVFLFRYTPSADPALPPQPTIYRLNMLDPATYFLTQRFPMRDKDVLYVSNASINKTAKFVSIVNQLFSPFIAARAVAN